LNIRSTGSDQFARSDSRLAAARNDLPRTFETIVKYTSESIRSNDRNDCRDNLTTSGRAEDGIDKASFVLGNIQNHIDGVGGADNVTIALVIHGQALRAFHSASANPDIVSRVGQFSRAGLELATCGNTMNSQNVGRKDLLPASLPLKEAAWWGWRSCNRRANSIWAPDCGRTAVTQLCTNTATLGDRLLRDRSAAIGVTPSDRALPTGDLPNQTCPTNC
jgi:intracellular sulfur oxidation DsrE/DsrF family protein